MSVLVPARPASHVAAPAAVRPGWLARVRLEYVWAVLPFAFAFRYAASVPITHSDLFYMMLNGRLMAQGQFPLTGSPFTYAPEQAPFYNQPWLAQLLWWAADTLGGYPGIIFLHALVIGGAFAALTWLAYRLSGDIRVASATTLLGLLVCITNLSIRPQSFALLPFVACYALLRLSKPGQWSSVLAMGALCMLWANLHGSFFLGVALAGAHAVGAVVEERSLSTARVRHNLWLLAAAALGTLLNPAGPMVWAYVWRATNDPTNRTFIAEWQPTNLTTLTGQLALVAAVVALGVIVWTRRWPRITDLLIVLGLGLGALASQRSVMWWGLSLTPLLATHLANLRSLKSGVRQAAKQLPLLNASILAILAIVTLLGLPWLRPVAPLLTPDLRSYLSADHPTGAVDYLQQTNAHGRLFTRMEWGGYLAWSLWPSTQVYLDARIEQHPPAVWQDYFRLLRAEPGWQDRLAVINPDYVLLERQPFADLVQDLRADPDWQVVYQDDLSVLFQRAS